MRAGGQVARDLKGSGLKETVTEQINGVGDTFWRKLLSTTEGITGRCAPDMIQTPRINYAQASGRTALIRNLCDCLRWFTGKRRERHCHKTHAPAIRHIHKSGSFHVRTVID